MPKYVLTYFNVRARVEVSRMIFAAAGVDFEDVRVPFEQWPEKKKKVPFGALPVLEVDGTTIAQSLAIARFLANEFGLAGKTNLEKAKVDMIGDAFNDLFTGIVKWWFTKDEAEKKELREVYVTKTVPNTLAALVKLLEANNGGNGFFVGDSLTWADLAFLVHCDYYLGRLKDANLLAPHKKLVALRERLVKLPKIKKYFDTRPESNPNFL
ncbi:putative glutathione S-transferase 6 [Glandiceps talaboti]